MGSTSLLTGWLPIALTVLGLAGLLFLLARRERWWWLYVVPAVAVFSAAVSWLLSTVVARNMFADALPFELGVYVALGVASIALAIGHMVRTPWWDKLVAVLAAVLVVAAAGNQINIYFQYYPTVSDLAGVDSDNEIVGPPSLTTGSTAPTRPSGPLVDSWTPAGADMPDVGQGKVSQIDLPGTKSGFQGRQGWVYYPPAYFADNPEPLPVVLLLHGQPGDPGDWFLGSRAQDVMNSFAADHKGIAPIIVAPDVLGSETDNPLCMDSTLGNMDTFLSVDVPAAIEKQLRADPDTKRWVVAGFSYGGTCSLQLVTNHPDLFTSFVDISGQKEPTLGSRDQTVQAAFGGDASKFTAVNPVDIMKAKKFPDTAGWVIVGADDQQYKPDSKAIVDACKAAGMDVQYWESPGTGHDWGTAVNGLEHATPWIGTRTGLTS